MVEVFYGGKPYRHNQAVDFVPVILVYELQLLRIRFPVGDEHYAFLPESHENPAEFVLEIRDIHIVNPVDGADGPGCKMRFFRSAFFIILRYSVERCDPDTEKFVEIVGIYA